MDNLNKTGQECVQHQNLSFLDAISDLQVSKTTSMDPTVRQGNYGEAELGGFLARPIKIADYTWDISSPFFNILPPWDAWANNPAIKKKLDNFHMFRGTLNVKILINGSPFHFGKVMVSYEPLQDSSQLAEPAPGSTTSKTFKQAMIARSQRLNVKLDPSTDEGGCICCPFIWPDNYINVNKISDWEALGILRFESMMDLATVSTSSQRVTISVFAWCDDAELKIPTFALTASQSDEVDADSGIISAPASTVAAIANRLSDVPIIRPFAMAAEIGARAVGGIAKLFGYSRPVNINPANPMHRDPFGELANTRGADNVHKLTFDPKQAVTVDPRTVGLGSEDEMTILNIVKRESYLTAFEWVAGDAPGTALLSVPVNPSIGGTLVATSQHSFQPTALAFACLPFQYWSGTLKYRFEVMASRYHKGRLKIAWDPLSVANSLEDDNFNTNYVSIIDLEKTRNFEFPISWGSTEAYKEIPLDRGPDWTMDLFTATPAVADVTHANGYFSVTILNELICPVADSTIRINVYVSAGDDFQVAGPHSQEIDVTSYFPFAGPSALMAPGPEEGIITESQSGVVDSAEANEENQPKGAADVQPLVGSEFSDADTKSAVFFGDPISSFRTLLKRYNLHGVVWPRQTGTSIGTVIQFEAISPDFPTYYGFDPNGLSQANSAPFSAVFMTLANYLTPAYVGMRGGLRSKYLPMSVYNEHMIMVNRKVYRNPDGSDASWTTANVSNASVGFDGGPITSVWRRAHNMFEGAWTAITTQQQSANIELPFYSPKRFRFARWLNMNQGTSEDSSDRFFHQLDEQRVQRNNTDGNNLDTRWTGSERWVAVGDDFSLFYFVNAPLQNIYAISKPALTG